VSTRPSARRVPTGCRTPRTGGSDPISMRSTLMSPLLGRQTSAGGMLRAAWKRRKGPSPRRAPSSSPSHPLSPCGRTRSSS